jgi:hypothetical protein
MLVEQVFSVQLLMDERRRPVIRTIPAKPEKSVNKTFIVSTTVATRKKESAETIGARAVSLT